MARRWCCGGCSKCGVYDPEAAPLELCVVEASASSLKLGFRAPRAARHRCRPGEPLRFTVSVVGGPSGDLYGPRTEHVEAKDGIGALIEYEVTRLQPDTEYTFRVSADTEGGGPLWEELEARTAAADGPQFAPEDWASIPGESHKAKLLKKGSVDEVYTASSSPHLPGDDTSTATPSEIGRAESAAFGEDSESELGSPAAPVRPVPVPWAAPQPAPQPVAAAAEPAVPAGVMQASDEEVVVVSEVEPPTRRLLQCNLCSLLDCMKPSGPPTRLPADPCEIIVDVGRGSAAPAPEPMPAPQQRRLRPYRTPFPGVPVNPAEVGLQQLAMQNERQLTDRLVHARRLG